MMLRWLPKTSFREEGIISSQILSPSISSTQPPLHIQRPAACTSCDDDENCRCIIMTPSIGETHPDDSIEKGVPSQAMHVDSSTTKGTHCICCLLVCRKWHNIMNKWCRLGPPQQQSGIGFDTGFCPLLGRAHKYEYYNLQSHCPESVPSTTKRDHSITSSLHRVYCVYKLHIGNKRTKQSWFLYMDFLYLQPSLPLILRWWLDPHYHHRRRRWRSNHWQWWNDGEQQR